ncbi:MAG TPA: FimV/HubP family polar landmark protein, partial [Steroidobacteraceae bacterium]
MIRKALGGALVILLALPPAAWALGLGDIRLASSLNAPITAEIELLGATPEELSSLKATLASRETFTRYGLDYPALLNSITVTRGRSADGRDVLAVRSTEAATEPFLTLLVEVNWARGRLVREYTVLLDPPVYAANATAVQAPPVAAPAATAPRSGPVERPAPAPAASASPQAAEMPVATPRTSVGAGAAGGETYQVRPGDSLSRIVRGVAKDPATARRTMVAIYRANPKAFEGNMNLLRSGEVLRMPDDSQVAAVSASEALAQVRQDQSAWRGHAAAGTSSGGGAASSARLRLVPPTEGAASAGATAAATSGVGADAAALKGRVKDLESQLAESKRLLDLRNAELANLQAKLGGAKAP